MMIVEVRFIQSILITRFTCQKINNRKKKTMAVVAAAVVVVAELGWFLSAACRSWRIWQLSCLLRTSGAGRHLGRFSFLLKYILLASMDFNIDGDNRSEAIYTWGRALSRDAYIFHPIVYRALEILQGILHSFEPCWACQYLSLGSIGYWAYLMRALLQARVFEAVWVPDPSKFWS